MNNNQNVGESSKGQENGDSKSKQDRPLKKARFAWQIKGKHHLKTDSNENNNNEPSTAHVDAHVKECVPLETTYPLSQMKHFTPFSKITDFGMINLEAARAQSETICNICYEDRNYGRGRICRVCTHSIYENNTMSAAKKRPITDDLALQEWQAVQESKCLLDNLVNKVLDTWTSNPLLGVELGVEQSVENFDNNVGNNEVVNEGILMAISAHGLQNAPDAEDSTDIPTPDTMEVVPSASSSTSQSNSTQQLSSKYCYSDYIENDFLDAAVEFAILNKGLTSSATEFG